MKRSGANQRATLIALAVLAGLPAVLDAASPAAQAQTAARISNQQLDSLSAPIALYPDALLAQVLMASTFPQDIAAAAAWSRAHPNTKGDDAVRAVAGESWDPSVQSLVAFPQVLATMASKPDWVAQLGNAFLAQPNDVMDSVQRLRRQAQQTGNLKTSEQQKVIVEESTIQIVPANPQVVYVPTYNPTVVYGTWPYPAYPPVYVPPPPGYAAASGLAAGLAFGVGVAITSALWSDVNWNNHSVNINVNRYNNINVNRRLDVNSNTARWNRDTTFNRNASANLGSAQRDAYRGRDVSASRAQAQQALQSRTGQNLGGNASERLQSIQHGGTNGGNVRASAQNLNRDNALRSAGNGAAARQDIQRGQASREAQGSSARNGFSAGRGQERGSSGGGGTPERGRFGTSGAQERGGLGTGGAQPRNALGPAAAQPHGGLGAGGGGQRHLGRQR
ncbi:DUF3300 domain-containing protein [Paraburkholderia phenoliruptrix]|uniref:DUF3300 domain-containing protein n=2 Tax=Paraburkholderia phenoliruptrix TaxID=252970 RepID=K0DZE9_9BURK|nr:DUF3300 domain-containing protein [Paraburkholderia phenoliruptrix]AFT89473.1 hypothetical protein BUPH_05615 [Paraburkholderia phenoliruptrix BR3459a]MDR6421870.1 hypothetical protein [Paraburkholderia phenoliruptrix]CAB4050585.1 hypothetical protein LMG9964_04252 [Paraburkholderia phenoliruptrix]